MTESTNRLSLRRLIPAALLVPYLAALLLVTWLPASDAEPATGIVARIAELLSGLVPFDAGYAVLEFLANVALFVPLGILMTLAWPRLPWWAVTLTGFALTVTIELVQLTMPSRVSAISDVIANTGGTLLGVVIVVLLRRVRGKTAPSAV